MLSQLWQSTPRDLREKVGLLVEQNADAISAAFYEDLLRNLQAQEFLSHEVVQTRLRASLTGWLSGLFNLSSDSDWESVVKQHVEIGTVHVRISMPMYLVSLGMSIVKRELTNRMIASNWDPSSTVEGLVFVNETLDIALSAMNESYFLGAIEGAKHHQSLKVVMMGHHLAIEYERLKASLFDWQRAFMMAIYSTDGGDYLIPSLKNSDLWLWTSHKAEFIIGDTQELPRLRSGLERLEATVSEVIRRRRSTSEVLSPAMLSPLNEAVTALAMVLSTLVEKVIGMESARDALTRVLNRRYLSSVLQQEVRSSRQTSKPFGLLLIDIDHFKKINDTYGHETGDQVLVRIAEILGDQVRAGDFVFRYGGEEFLVILAEVDWESAEKKAEQIRQAVANISAGQKKSAVPKVTASIGVALHDGHPDYKKVVNRADLAMYHAKVSGRNQVVRADSLDADSESNEHR